MDSTGGSLPDGTPYTAGVNLSQSQTYTVTGPLANFTRITANGQTNLSTSASGAGIAQVQAANPGNMIAFNFTISRPQYYQLQASLSCPGYNNPGEVRLQRFDGVTWQYLNTTLFLPQSQGTLNVTSTMQPGNYRLEAAAAINCSGSNALISTFSYQLDMLPNPVTVAGRVDLLDFVGNVAAETMDFEIRSFNGTLLDTAADVPLDALGNYTFTTAVTGNFLNVCARGRTWLKNSVPNQVLTAFQTTNVNIACQNGDADQSAEVDAADIDWVISHFGETVGGGPYDQNSDLDGSGEVDAADIDVAIANFGATDDF